MTGSIVVDGMTISVHETSSTGPPVVLCHGNSCSRNAFRNQVEGEFGRAHRLVTFDFPGHGDSSRAVDPDRTYTIPGYARVLCAVARAADAQKAVFAGWSLGGHVVLEAIPDLGEAAGFFLFGTTPVGIPAALDRSLVQSPELAAGFRAESTESEVRAFVARFVRLGSPAPTVLYDDFRRTDGRARAALAASVERAQYRDELAIMAAMQKPLAIVHGAHDRIANGAYFAELEIPTLWRRAIQWIPHVGHAPHWEAPRAFDEILRVFVAECQR